MSMQENRRPKFVDLFAGCGGLSLGLEIAGFEPIFVSELNPNALETYLINRDTSFPLLRSRLHVKDIKELVIKQCALIEDLKTVFKT